MGLFNNRNKYDFKLWFNGDLREAKLKFDENGKVSGGLPSFSMGISEDVLRQIFTVLFACMQSAGMNFKADKMIDRKVGKTYQTVLYPTNGGKIQFMCDIDAIWVDLSCDLEMSKQQFISVILQPTVDALKEAKIHVSIK